MILGHVGLSFVLPMSAVRGLIHLPGITRDFVPIEFLLDTGSTHTCLHPPDATLKAGIDLVRLEDPDQWPRRLSARGIGGMAMGYVWPAVYQFKHDGRVRQITHEIEIARPNATNAMLPSLLGTDILRQFRVNMDYVGLHLALE